MGFGRHCLLQSRYGLVVDTTRDDEVWSMTAPLNLIGGPLDPATRPSVDVIVHCNYGSASDQITAALSERMWVDRKRAPPSLPRSDWTHSGVRIRADDPQKVAQNTASVFDIVHTGMGHQSFAVENGNPLRLPTEQTSRYRDADARKAADWAAVESVLAKVKTSRTGWLSPTIGADGEFADGKCPQVGHVPSVQCWDLEIPDPPLGGWDAKLPRDESDGHALPVSASLVLHYLLDGEVASGRVALVDARMNDVCTLRLPPHQAHIATNNREETFEALRTATAGAELIIFYCNHASSNSPSRAAAYHLWLHQLTEALVDSAALPVAIPTSAVTATRPRIRMLSGGAGQLVREASRVCPSRMKDLFKAYDKSYAS